jgi:hypothetical protein
MVVGLIYCECFTQGGKRRLDSASLSPPPVVSQRYVCVKCVKHEWDQKLIKITLRENSIDVLHRLAT